MSSTYNVYKCLDNNGNAASTVEPTGTSTSILSTADGYKWKYMYTLICDTTIKLLSTDFMAVATNSTVSSAATDGAINIVKIKTAGTGGTDGTHTGIAIRGDGSSGTVSVTVSSGSVTAVTVTMQVQVIHLVILELQILFHWSNRFIRYRIRCYH